MFNLINGSTPNSVFIQVKKSNFGFSFTKLKLNSFPILPIEIDPPVKSNFKMCFCFRELIQFAQENDEVVREIAER